MTTELTKAAQQALEALRANAIHYGDPLRCSRYAIAALERALTQRPAAQNDRGLFEELWAKPNNVQLTLDVNQRDYHYPQAKAGWSAWQFRASLPAPQQATPERHLTVTTNQQGEAVMVSWQDDEHRILDVVWERKPATPEPVGEPSQFPPLPEGWPARFRCDSCDGNGEIGELVSMGHFQPPERQTCPDCGGRGWASEEPAFNAEHMREFAEAHARNTRPVPGVPEDVLAILDGCRNALMECDRDGDYALIDRIDALAAAQAKGAAHD